MLGNQNIFVANGLCRYSLRNNENISTGFSIFFKKFYIFLWLDDFIRLDDGKTGKSSWARRRNMRIYRTIDEQVVHQQERHKHNLCDLFHPVSVFFAIFWQQMR
jgi:hypothetical protein